MPHCMAGKRKAKLKMAEDRTTAAEQKSAERQDIPGTASCSVPITATLSWHLFVDCPECDNLIDLADTPHDDDGYFSIPIFNNRWDDCKGNEVECPNCRHEFTIDEIEY